MVRKLIKLLMRKGISIFESVKMNVRWVFFREVIIPRNEPS